MITAESIRNYFGNDQLTLNGLNQIRLEETAQTIGQVFESESEVTDHLRTLCLDNGSEWEGVDAPMLYHQPGELSQGLKYIGDDLWLQLY